MTRPQKVFRYLWRVNAILILVAAGAVTFGVGAFLVSEFTSRAALRRQAEAAPAVGVAEIDSRLLLSQATVVAGTPVMRAQLHLYGNGKGYGEIRNVLFIEPGEKTARWLLSDNHHVVSDWSEIVDDDGPREKRIVATALLVKPASGEPDFVKGRLLLFDPSGKRVVEAADGVRRIQVVSVAKGEITLLYERDRRLVLATFDADSFANRSEQAVAVPQLR
jgi:hypothetical protein